MCRIMQRKKGIALTAVVLMTAGGIAAPTSIFGLAAESESAATVVSRSDDMGVVLDSHRPACTRGSTLLGAGRGEIRFLVWCAPAGGGQSSRFAINRYSAKRIQAGSDIRSVSLREGARDAGNCRIVKGAVSCKVRMKRPVKVSGTILVPPGQRCSKRVLISVVEPPNCRSGYCEAVLDLDYLANGRPRGC